MHQRLTVQHSLNVSRNTARQVLRILDPKGVNGRSKGSLFVDGSYFQPQYPATTIIVHCTVDAETKRFKFIVAAHMPQIIRAFWSVYSSSQSVF